MPLSWFRDRPRFAPLRNADANIVPLCEPCHKLVERRNPNHARIELRRVLYAHEVAFVLQTAGTAWFDWRYPPGATAAPRAPFRVASSPGLGATD